MFFSKNDGIRTPFGKNVYLRSTQDVKTESYTFYNLGIPSITIDGDVTKVLQPGTVIAKITSGLGSGMVGVFQAGVSDGRQTPANIVGVTDTFLPWELMERHANIAVVYEATVVQAWCFEYNSTVAVPLGNTTRDAMLALPNVNLRFK